MSSGFSPVSSSGSLSPTHFRIGQLSQTNVLDAIKGEQTATSTVAGISLEILRPFAKAVGTMSHNSKHLGNCSLISLNLAMIPCHCIDDVDVRELRANFGYVCEDNTHHPSMSYNVCEVIAHDQGLNYAIIKLDGQPGLIHGHLKPDSKEVISNTVALLHHPLSKPLKLSINQTTQVTNEFFSRLVVSHDTDLGSAGGAYLNPSGNMVALHLGSTRGNEKDPLQIIRLALPISKIVTAFPNGILAQYIRGDSLDPLLDQYYSIPPQPRSFIGQEKFNKTKLNGEGYLLREIGDRIAAIYIDIFQKKHGRSSTDSGNENNYFNPKTIMLDDIIEIGEVLTNHFQSFKETPSKDISLNTLSWSVDRDRLSRGLYHKLHNVARIELDGRFVSKQNAWYIHFYPVQK